MVEAARKPDAGQSALAVRDLQAWYDESHILHGINFDVAPGDTICIPPGTPHCIEADAGGSLRMLCCCSPAYTHADTWILGPEQQEPQ